MWARFLGAFSFQLCVAVQKLRASCCGEVAECPHHSGWDYALRARWAEVQANLVRSRTWQAERPRARAARPFAAL